MTVRDVKTILVALELSDGDGVLLDAARTYAGAFSAAVWLVHVVPEDPAFVGYPKQAEAAEGATDEPSEVEVGYAYDRLQRAQDARAEHGEIHERRAELERLGTAATALLVAGMPDRKIVAEASRLGAGLIIMGARHRSVLGEILFGSTAREVLRSAPCPVLLVPLPA